MIIPAIDLIDGQIVRLYQGDYAQTTFYPIDILDQVAAYEAAGASVLHIVDLTGAKDTSKRQLGLIKKMTASTNMLVQAGGGIRSRNDVEELLAAGVKRVVIGSKAVSDIIEVKGWFNDFGPEAIVLALDVNIDENGNRLVATHGWQQGSGVRIETLLDTYSEVGLKHVLCTDISKDGTLAGSNVALYTDLVAQYPNIIFQASGGIGNLDDIRALTPSKVQSVIMGRSLLENKCTLADAIAIREALSC